MDKLPKSMRDSFVENVLWCVRPDSTGEEIREVVGEWIYSLSPMTEEETMKVTTHGAKNKGTKQGTPRGNRGGSHAQHPAMGVSSANSRKYAFPSTGGMRRDK